MSELKLGEYWSTPLPRTGIEPETQHAQLSAALCALCRGLPAYARRLDMFERRPATMADLLSTKYDAARLATEVDPSPLAVAREALRVLQSALGKSGVVHNVSEPGVAGSCPVELSTLEEYLDALEQRHAELVRALQPPVPVARAGRVAA